MGPCGLGIVPNPVNEGKGFSVTIIQPDTLLPHGPARRDRRLARFSQADAARALRAAKQVSDDYGVRIEPDGAIVIGRLVVSAAIIDKTPPVRDFRL